jgi:ATP-dependent protease HslVU (ClpYQ) peptidase subunit
MTTIVYDHKNGIIACDSRVTRGGVTMSDKSQKWYHKGADILFLAGTISDIKIFLENYGKTGFKPDCQVDLDAFLVRNGTVYECSFCKNSGYWELRLNYNSALGSGQSFALAALDFGKTASEAVAYAATRDIYTGGEIFAYDVKTASFI